MQPKSARRLERIGELLKRTLSEILIKEFGQLPEIGLITVHEVEVSADLKYATAYVGILGSEEVQQRGLAFLNQHRKMLQDMLVNSVILRRAPTLRFVLDKSTERGTRVLQIIDQLDQENRSSSLGDKNHPQIKKIYEV